MLKQGIKILASFVFLATTYCGQLYSQSGCPSVSVGPAVTLPCGTKCRTLQATAFPSGSTTSYNVSQISYNPLSYSAGTPVLVHIDDKFSGVIDLPFNFCFFGNVYTSVIIGSNGVISFDTANANGACPFSVSYTVPGGNVDFGLYNSILAPWSDIDPTYRGTITYQVFGTAPCRMFVVSWDSIPLFGDPNSTVYTRDPSHAPYTTNQYFETSQLVMYETSNVIDINIMSKDTVSGWNGGRAIEGIVNSDATAAFTVPGRNDSVWLVQNDAWRFTPNGQPAIYSIAWYQGANLLGVGDSIEVCPSAALQTTYTAVATITPCGGDTPIIVADSVVVSLSGTLLAAIDSSKNVTCNNTCDGIGWAHISGGSPTVNYFWADSLTPSVSLGSTFKLPSLCPGTYIFTAIDTGNCVRSMSTHIGQPTAQSLTLLSQTSSSCIANDGSVTVIDTGGTPGYNYKWSNNETGQAATGLGQGPVSVTVNDANGCTISQTYNVQQTSSVVTNPVATNPKCFQIADGTIDANPSNGTPPYKFEWNNGENQQVATDLGTGAYACVVTDSFGCSAMATANLVAPAQLSMSPSSVPVSCPGENNGVIVAIPSGGTLPYLLTATSDDANFTSDSDGVMNGLSPGNYTVILADNNGCTITKVTNVPGATPDSFQVTVDSTLCFGYSDGTAYIVDNSPANRPYQYSIDSSGQFQYSSGFFNLSPGDHIITTINKNGCTTQVPVVVPEPPAIIVGISPDTVVLALGQSLQVAVNYNNAGNPSYSWSPSFGLSCMDCPNPVVGPYVMEDYSVTVSSINGVATCYGYANLHVTVLPPPPYFIPNSFTPNGDGSNDLFEIYGESIKTIDLKIFNRWGELVFQSRDQFAGWDGTFKGQLQPPGVFSYNAMITFLDNTQSEKSGSVTLLR